MARIDNGNRGLASHIGMTLQTMELPDVFTARDVRPYITHDYPNATGAVVTSALETLRLHGMVSRISRGSYRRLRGGASPSSNTTNAIDRALDALALAEQALRESKEKLELLDRIAETFKK